MTGSVAAPAWLAAGCEIEVLADEDGLRGSRYAARVLLPPKQGKVRLQYATILCADGQSALREAVDATWLRPPPPPTPPDFFASLQTGDPLELWHGDGWWEVNLTDAGREASDGAGKLYAVRSPHYASEYRVSAQRLRPRWTFCGSHWKAEVLQLAPRWPLPLPLHANALHDSLPRRPLVSSCTKAPPPTRLRGRAKHRPRPRRTRCARRSASSTSRGRASARRLAARRPDRSLRSSPRSRRRATWRRRRALRTRRRLRRPSSARTAMAATRVTASCMSLLSRTRRRPKRGRRPRRGRRRALSTRRRPPRGRGFGGGGAARAPPAWRRIAASAPLVGAWSALAAPAQAGRRACAGAASR